MMRRLLLPSARLLAFLIAVGQHRVVGEVGLDAVAIELQIKSVRCTLLQTAVFSMDDANGLRRHYCATPGSTANAVTRVQIRGLVAEWSVWAPVTGAMDRDTLCTPPSPELCDSGGNEVPLFENVFTQAHAYADLRYARSVPKYSVCLKRPFFERPSIVHPRRICGDGEKDACCAGVSH